MIKPTSQKPPKVFLIVLLYNGMKWLENCMDSLTKTNYPNFEIVVVDNVSTDESVKYIRENYPQITIIENDENKGTAEGNNIGIRYALNNGADYVALFNQDIRVDPNWLNELMPTAQKSKEIGIVSPIQLNYEGKEIDPIFSDILKDYSDYFKDLYAHNLKDHYGVPVVVGASWLIKREVFDELGIFDPIYFMYFEDAEFCRRALFKGFKISIVPKAIVYHHHNLSQNHAKEGFLSSYLMRRNSIIYGLKDNKHSIIYRLKSAFVWNSHKPFRRSKNLMEALKLMGEIAFLFPKITIHRYKEQRGPSYL